MSVNLDDSQKMMIDKLKSTFAENPEMFDNVVLQAEELAAASPNNAWLHAEIGGIFDSSGKEHEACKWYERALQFGLDAMPPEMAPHFCVWYGSTLRNVGRLVDSENVLRRALERWPRISALQFFLALTLMSQGRSMEAITALAELQLPEWDDSIKTYKRAVESYLSEELRPAAKNLTLGCVRVIVRNIDESVPWYQKVLGVPVSVSVPHFALFRVGGGLIELVEADEKNPESIGGTIAYWNANPIDEWMERFEKHGATLYRGPSFIEEEKLTICQFRDPFGTVIGLMGYGAKRVS
jgi:tetratricopeptide (TPR) repeat protein